MRITSGIAIMALASVIVTSAKAQSDSDQPPENLPIYLLMGQSNMSGRGDVDDLPPSLRRAKSVWLYGNDGVWRIAIEPLDDPAGEVDTVSSDGVKAGVGPGLTFAVTMGNEMQPVGLVTCAKGGSSLTQWTPNAARTRLYGSCLARAREASARGRIAGVLWYQGETDAEKNEAASVWAVRMKTLIASLRRDLNNPCLPWVIVGLSDRPDPERWRRPTQAWNIVQTAQVEIAASVANVGYVSAVGLPKNGDGIHLSTAAQLQLGPKLAKTMKALDHTPCRLS